MKTLIREVALTIVLVIASTVPAQASFVYGTLPVLSGLYPASTGSVVLSYALNPEHSREDETYVTQSFVVPDGATAIEFIDVYGGLGPGYFEQFAISFGGRLYTSYNNGVGCPADCNYFIFDVPQIPVAAGQRAEFEVHIIPLLDRIGPNSAAGATSELGVVPLSDLTGGFATITSVTRNGIQGPIVSSATSPLNANLSFAVGFAGTPIAAPLPSSAVMFVAGIGLFGVFLVRRPNRRLERDGATCVGQTP